MFKNAIPDSILVSNYIQGCETSLETLIKKHLEDLQKGKQKTIK